jgi:hypothetical protein
VDGLSVPDGTIVFVHQPNPCCHSETGLVLTAWNDGDTETTLELGGQVVKTSVVPGADVQPGARALMSNREITLAFP